MIDLNTLIVPYKGTGIFELYADYKDVVARMQAAHIDYKEEVWDATDIDPPWTIITVGNNADIQLFFANYKLWKIVLMNNFGWNTVM